MCGKVANHTDFQHCSDERDGLGRSVAQLSQDNRTGGGVQPSVENENTAY